MSKQKQLEIEVREKLATDMGYKSWDDWGQALNEKKEDFARELGYETFRDMIEAHDPLNQRLNVYGRIRIIIIDVMYFLYKRTILYKKYKSGYNDALDSIRVSFQDDAKIQKFTKIHKK